MDSKLYILSYQIEYLRAKLYKLLLNKNFADKKVIFYSEELDKLINEYQNLCLCLNRAA